jgi:hypothetical protein
LTIEHVDDRKIDSAKQFVTECEKNERGFCYAEVKRYPLDTGKDIRKAIELLKRERMSYLTTSARATIISEKLKVLKHIERGHYSYDRVAYLELRKNYDKLHSALTLLQSEGIVNSFTLRPKGYLLINWFTEYHFEDIVVIEQGWTFEERENWDYHRALRQRMENLYNIDSIPVKQDDVTGANDEYSGNSKMNNTGFIDPQKYNPPESMAGAGNISTKSSHYKHNVVYSPHQGGVTWATKTPLADWLIAVIAYYMPAKELGKVVDQWA